MTLQQLIFAMLWQMLESDTDLRIAQDTCRYAGSISQGDELFEANERTTKRRGSSNV
jgi:hypothetical protein